MEYRDLIIIGGGIAGLSAGLYAARGKVDALLLESGMPGSQAATTGLIENYPGFAEGIYGPELVAAIKKQAEKFGLKFALDRADIIKRDGRQYVIEAASGSYLCKAVIVASGAVPRKLAVEGEKEFTGSGVSYCAICDGPFFEDLEVAVVGGGDAALEEAVYLTKFASRVYVIHRRRQFRAAASIVEQARANDKITFVLDSTIRRIYGEGVVEGVEISCAKTGAISQLAVSGVFIYIGTEPNTGLLKDLVEMDSSGFIIVDENKGTSMPGIYAAGDICKSSIRQVVSAAADGAIAALNAEKYLNHLTEM